MYRKLNELIPCTMIWFSSGISRLAIENERKEKRKLGGRSRSECNASIDKNLYKSESELLGEKMLAARAIAKGLQLLRV